MDFIDNTAKPDTVFFSIAKKWFGYLIDINLMNYKDTTYEKEYINIISYFLYYGFLPLYLPESCCEENKFRITLITLSSAPWMGAVSERYSYPLKKLIDIELLIYGHKYKEVKFSINLNFEYKFIPQEIRKSLIAFQELAISAHEKRFLLHTDLGWTLGANNLKKDIEDILKKTNGEVTIKLIAYHGRTWFGVDNSSGFIQDMVDKYKDLKIKILLVDPKANIVVREGATEEEHNLSSQNGMMAIRNLSKKQLKRIEIKQ